MPILKDIYLWALKDLKDKNMKIDPRSFEYYMPKDRKEKKSASSEEAEHSAGSEAAPQKTETTETPGN